MPGSVTPPRRSRRLSQKKTLLAMKDAQIKAVAYVDGNGEVHSQFCLIHQPDQPAPGKPKPAADVYLLPEDLTRIQATRAANWLRDAVTGKGGNGASGAADSADGTTGARQM